MAKELNESNFAASTATGTVLLDFWAPWCRPCNTIAPVVDAAAMKYAGRAGVYKINIDDNAELVRQFDVRSIPTLVVMKDGAPVGRHVGTISASALNNMLDQHL